MPVTTPDRTSGTAPHRVDRTAAELLQAYSRSDIFLRTPARTLLGRGRQAGLRPDVPRSSLAEHAQLSALADGVAGGAGIVLGSIPFAAEAPAQLVVPETLWSAVDECRPGPSARSLLVPGCRLVPVPSAAVYRQAVTDALAAIKAGRLRKVVLARALDLFVEHPVDVGCLLRELLHRRSGDYVFAVPLPSGRTLVGASPELLVSRTDAAVRAVPLAGSAPRSDDPAEDRQRAAALLASEKTRHEHAVVVSAVADALAPLCTALSVPDEPSLMSTPTMWHLATTVTGRAEHSTALELALALHPTPAVCGTPVDLAAAAIGGLEPFDRGYFAGATGWLDAAGNGEWTVTLRCAEIGENTLRLFAGAGIVAGSVPAEEADETTAKFATLLSVLGVADATE